MRSRVVAVMCHIVDARERNLVSGMKCRETGSKASPNWSRTSVTGGKELSHVDTPFAFCRRIETLLTFERGREYKEGEVPIPAALSVRFRNASLLLTVGRYPSSYTASPVVHQGKKGRKQGEARPFPGGSLGVQSERLSFNQNGLTARNGFLFINLIHEAEKHWLGIEPPVEPKAVFVQVGLQIALPNRMVNASYPIFYETPEPFDGVRVDVSDHVHFGTVIDPPMIVSAIHMRDAVIAVQFVREDCALGKNVFTNHAEKRRAFHVISGQGLDASTSFDNTDDCGFLAVASHRATTPIFTDSAHVGFVHLYAWGARTTKRIRSLFQHGANLLKHAPRRFVSDSGFPLDLLCGDAATCRGHEIHGIEPRCERSGRLVEDRIRRWVDVMAAMVARVGRATHNAMVLRFLLALVAERHSVRMEVMKEPVKARHVIGEHRVKLFLGETLHFWFAVHV
jgi:hypothetical protein